MMTPHKVYPCLWFDGTAKEAAEFYCSIFPNSKILSVTDMVVHWEINRNKFMGLNGGPHFKFNEAVSFNVLCDTQEQIDFYWEKFTSNGGEESRCGWCKDKFGLSWQVVPSCMGELMSTPDRAKRVTDAFMKMRKMDIETLKKA